MSQQAKAFAVFTVGYAVVATACIMIIKRGISKAIDEEYRTLCEKMK